MNDNTNMKHFTRGGQTFLHNFRMANQIVNRVIIACFIVFIITTVGIEYFITTDYERYVLGQLVHAHIAFFFMHNATQLFIDQLGETFKVCSKDLIASDMAAQVLHGFAKESIKAMLGGAMMTAAFFFFVYYWLRKRGETQTGAKRIRGDEFASVKTVNHLIKKHKKKPDIKIGQLSLPKNFEVRHTFVHGTQGTGKSALLRCLLDQIKERGDRAIVYDKGHTFVPDYYQEGQDIMMNVLDERTPPWSIWEECKDFADFDSMAAGLIPMPESINDPFWITGARLVFSASARQMAQDKDRSMFKLLKTLLSADMTYMGQLLKGTEAEAYSVAGAEKTVLGIKAVLAIYLKYLKYVKAPTEGATFSLSRWVEDSSQKSWIFFSSVAKKHETLRPLITTWLDVIIKALMSLPDCNKRRIWIILDELPTLNALPCLINAFAETRKFGGALVVGVQNIAMLRKCYGIDGADAILDLCKTKFFLNSPSYKIAQWASQELGQEELEETREGTSYSESAMRSGISISTQRYARQVVSPSEIMRMDDLEAYARLPGGLPITKTKLFIKGRNKIALPFIERTVDERSFNELDGLIEQAEKACHMDLKLENQDNLAW